LIYEERKNSDLKLNAGKLTHEVSQYVQSLRAMQAIIDKGKALNAQLHKQIAL